MRPRVGVISERSTGTRPSAWAAACLAVLAGAASAEPGPPRETPARFDWCAPVVSRPLRRFSDPEACVPTWTLREIAAGVDVVLIGASEVTGDAAPRDRCAGALDSARYAGWAKELKTAAAEQGRNPLIVLSTRFDLVGSELGERPGFDPAFLLRTGRPFGQVVDFFEKDVSPDCAAGCRFAAAPRRRGPDEQDRLAARIDALGGAGRSGSVVWYLAPSAPGRTTFRATSALADLRSPGYRAWRVAETRRALAALGADAAYLGHKLHQYRSGVTHFVASRAAPDVTSLNRLRDTLWTAPPEGYGYTDYVRGWREMARSLREGGVPYVVLLPSGLWTGDHYDDPATEASEAEWLREAARGARAVLLDRSPRVSAAQAETIQRELAAGGAQVVPVDTRCGRRDARSPAPGP